ncbi:hypothetical protein LBMAG15_05120 [Actinomycetes bacterium]|nr:hypothetical protein LBMAG15_05120 [Actinomycetes bacterium]
MKFPGEAAERLAHSLLDVGPTTATELADRLRMTAAGIRRQLTALQEAGLVTAGDRAPYGPAPAPRRGRPSQVFSLTASGRAALNGTYDDLAVDVLRFVQETQGAAGVRAFAERRAKRLIQQVLPTNYDDITGTAEEIAIALTAAGYAASIETGDQGVTVQLCQHNCPVVDAAAEFPVLCDAETLALGTALGRHVTRLATLAHGDGVCTTVIPVQDARVNFPSQISTDPIDRRATR